MKVFPDTNVLASALATRGFCAGLFESVLTGHELLASTGLLAELRRILTTKLRIPVDPAEPFITLIEANATTLPTPAEFPAGIPDPYDAPLIAVALAGGAECFVTGDKAFLNLETVTVLPAPTFWKRLMLHKLIRTRTLTAWRHGGDGAQERRRHSAKAQTAIAM